MCLVASLEDLQICDYLKIINKYKVKLNQIEKEKQELTSKSLFHNISISMNNNNNNSNINNNKQNSLDKIKSLYNGRNLFLLNMLNNKNNDNKSSE